MARQREWTQRHLTILARLVRLYGVASVIQKAPHAMRLVSGQERSRELTEEVEWVETEIERLKSIGQEGHLLKAATDALFELKRPKVSLPKTPSN